MPKKKPITEVIYDHEVRITASVSPVDNFSEFNNVTFTARCTNINTNIDKIKKINDKIFKLLQKEL
jgi:hypothetical protein